MRSSPLRRLSLLVFALVVPCQIGFAQGFDLQWLEFQQDPSRLSADNALVGADIEERDYATGDFDQDGWVDLAIVRKLPLHTTGKRRNVLLMNENGVLQDRTNEYAARSVVPGDKGFLTPTNDRDVVAVDVDGDGWLDLVTATTLTPNGLKHISHPRVYMNLQNTASGAWRGFRYEHTRIPQLLLSNGEPSFPRFTAVAAGDVTGDGFADLYFGDNDDAPGLGGGDMNDRLLVNDGTGFFIDESTLRLSPAMLTSPYTTSVNIEDVNGDGLAEIIRNRGFFFPISIVYNDPANVGFFMTVDEFYTNFSYFVNTGDLNNDGQIDLVVSDNSEDTFLLNQGTGPGGINTWTTQEPYTFLTDADDGFGANSYIVDFDNDGWNDVIICDFDIQLDGCDRRTHIYHNAGGTPGGSVVLREEAEASVGGWRGAVGLDPALLTGTHDAGIIDLDRDGDLDMVLGRCASTEVWMNQLAAPAWSEQGNALPGTTGSPLLIGTGSLAENSPFTLELSNAAPSALTAMFIGLSNSPTPFLGGTLVPVPWLKLLFRNTTPNGDLNLAFGIGTGVPNGTELWVQAIITDSGAPADFAFSNAIRGLVP